MIFYFIFKFFLERHVWILDAKVQKQAASDK